MNYQSVIRGAISVAQDTQEEILAATTRLFTTIVEKNTLMEQDLEAILFSATADLTAIYPAVAIRNYGWRNIPMMCFQEMSVKDAMPKIIRIMAFTQKMNHAPKHIYLDQAVQLRPDLIHEASNANN